MTPWGSLRPGRTGEPWPMTIDRESRSVSSTALASLGTGSRRLGDRVPGALLWAVLLALTCVVLLLPPTAGSSTPQQRHQVGLNPAPGPSNPGALARSQDQQEVFFRQTEGEHAEVVPVVVRDGRTKEIASDSGQLHSPSHTHLEAPKISKGKQLAYKARGQRGFMFVSIGWPGAPKTDLDPTDYDSLGQWFSDASNGLWRWDPVTVLELDLPRQPACNDLAWASATQEKLRSLGYSLNRDYAALGLVVPETVPSSCVDTAYAYLGCFLDAWTPCGLSIYSHRYTGIKTVIHELGHTLGLHHSSALDCRYAGDQYPVAFNYNKGQCLGEEYGDRYDIMGRGRSSPPPLFHPVHARSLGWMNEGFRNIPLDGERHTIDLDPYASFTGARAIEFRLPPEPWFGGFSPGKIVLEYRARFGLDRFLWETNSWCTGGPFPEQLLFRFFPSQKGVEELGLDTRKSYLLDNNLNTVNCDHGIIEGETWSDPRGLVEVEHQGIYEGKARVAVRLPEVTAAPLQWRVNRLDVAGRSFSARLVSDRYLRHISKRDFRFLRGRCRLSLSRSSLQSNKPLVIRLRSCRGRVVQLGLRPRAFVDEFSKQTPQRLLVSPKVRVGLGA